MIRIIQLLNEKNHFLEKFYSLNEVQILKLEKGEFQGLDQFYQQREELLKILKYIDEQLKKSHASHLRMHGTYDEVHKEEVTDAIRIKDVYIKKIVEQDLQVLGLIDEIKTQIIQELHDVRRAKKAMIGYGSSSIG